MWTGLLLLTSTIHAFQGLSVCGLLEVHEHLEPGRSMVEDGPPPRTNPHYDQGLLGKKCEVIQHHNRHRKTTMELLGFDGLGKNTKPPRIYITFEDAWT